MNPRLRLFSIFAGVLALPFSAAADATTLTELMGRVPQPPADVPTALTWIKDGTIVQPEYLEFQKLLAEERAAVAALNNGAPPAPGVSDTPEVQLAIKAYNEYLTGNSADQSPQAVLGKRKRWVQRAMGQRQLSINKSMVACPAPCANAEAAAKNGRLLQARAKTLGTELQMWNALFDDWRKKRASVVGLAEQRIAAAAGGEGATPEGRAAIASYRAAMLDEIELLFSVAQLSLQRAEVIDRGLDDSVPDSISGATKKTSTAAPGG